jgi:hypothetical protein
LDHPTLSGWARKALVELGQELPALTATDRVREFWMVLDCWGMLIEQGQPEEIADRLATAMGVAERIMEVVWRLGHPASADALAAIAAHSRDKKIAKAARRAIFKLRSARGG